LLSSQQCTPGHVHREAYLGRYTRGIHPGRYTRLYTTQVYPPTGHIPPRDTLLPGIYHPGIPQDTDLSHPGIPQDTDLSHPGITLGMHIYHPGITLGMHIYHPGYSPGMPLNTRVIAQGCLSTPGFIPQDAHIPPGYSRRCPFHTRI